MSTPLASTIGFALMSLTMVPFAARAAEPVNGRIEITGDYRYHLHATDNPEDGQKVACREAWRLAVVNSPVYREETAGVVDSPLLRDVAHQLATTHVQDQQVLEQSQLGKTVSCRVKGYLLTDDSVKVIRTQLAGGPPAPTDGLDRNRVLKLLNVQEEGGMLAVQYQVLKRIDWLNTHYQGSLRESADIMVDFFDHEGLLLRSERYEARRTPDGDDVMNPGSIAVLKVPKPPLAKTYRVWLVK